jgi:uncharacterized protein
MKQKLAFILTFFLLVTTIGSLIYTQNLQQKNSEKVFLTKESIRSYELFENNFSQKSILAIQSSKSKDMRKSIETHITSLCRKEIQKEIQEEIKDVCQIIGPSNLPQEAQNFLPLTSHDSYLQIFMVPMDQAQLMKSVVSTLKVKFPQIHLAGIPYTNFLLDKYALSIKTTLFPALFISVLILLFLTLKSVKEALFAFFPPLMASALSLLTTKLFFGTSTLITSIVPLLLFIINLSLILHIHHTAKEYENIFKALREKNVPILLMVITTFIGFGSLYLSQLEAISHFGILSSALFILTTLFCVLWSWCIGLIYPKLWIKTNSSASSSQINAKIFNYSVPWNLRKILLFSILCIGSGLFTYPKIPIITDATEYFPKREKIKETMVDMAKNLMGTPVLEIVIHPKKDDFSIDELTEIYSLENKIIKELQLKAISTNQLVALANSIYTGEKKLPPSSLAYYTLLAKSPPSLTQGLNHDEGHRITLLGGPTNIERYEENLQFIQNLFQTYKIEFNGLYYHLMVAQKQMILTLFTSFGISLILIAISALLYFKKIKLFFIFIIVNIIPVLGSFPLLYFIGNSFNVATVMTYSISLGLIVDSSFHIIHALDQFKLKGSFLEDPQEKHFFYKTIIIPILQSSLLLTFCFSFFYLSGFLPIREFGISLSVVIFLGMILDLKVLPTLYRL